MAAGSVVALMMASAAPAWAHAVFQQQSVPADTHTQLTLNVPVERTGAQNSRIEITLPDAFDAHSCTADEGWSCAVDNGKDAEHPGQAQVTFTRVHCMPESSYKCTPETEAPDATLPVAFGARSAALPRVMHGDDGDKDGGGGPGQAFRFLVHTPTKAGDYQVTVVQRYTTGEIVKWDGAPGSKTPAPSLHVGPAA